MGKHFGALIIDEVLTMRSEGKSHREIAEHFGFSDKMIIKKLVERYNKKQRKLEAGILPRPKGRPRKSDTSEAAKDIRIKQLEMEVELLRAFRSEFGRR